MLPKIIHIPDNKDFEYLKTFFEDNSMEKLVSREYLQDQTLFTVNNFYESHIDEDGLFYLDVRRFMDVFGLFKEFISKVPEDGFSGSVLNLKSSLEGYKWG